MGKAVLKKHRFYFFIFFILIFSLICAVFFQKMQVEASLDPFYELPAWHVKSKPGDIIRSEEMNIVVPGNGTAYRILYRSEYKDKTPTVSSGMIIVPNSPPPPDGYPIVAWAHGTVGMGNNCAPSRSNAPFSDIGGLSQILKEGYVVSATDYSGLGTEGIQRYLIGEDEARDVLNSVRAAKKFLGLKASNNFALWGHSQGGHAVLFSANIAKTYSPELNLVAVAAGAPAAELSFLLQQEYNAPLMWVIGPEISVSWSTVYKNLNFQSVMSDSAIINYKRLAFECTTPAGIEAIIRGLFKESYFSKDPTIFPEWQKAIAEQTPKPLESNIPLLVVQSLSDSIVLPNTTALFIQKSCDKKSNITVSWLPGSVSHIQTAIAAGPEVSLWLTDRFNGEPTENSCDQPLPIKSEDQ